MNIALIYVYAPHCGGEYSLAYPFRFLDTYHKFHPSVSHQTVVMCNSGSMPEPAAEALLRTLPNCAFLIHDNSGYDIGAFQHAAREVSADLMLFFGSSAYFSAPRWLERVIEAYERHGDTLYGTMVNAGDARVEVWPHVRTTGFWLSPALMNAYPHRVTQPDQRFGFEHKRHCLTQWVRDQGRTPWVVTTAGEYPPELWASFHAGFQQGRQDHLLIRDRYCDPPIYWAS